MKYLSIKKKTVSLNFFPQHLEVCFFSDSVKDFEKKKKLNSCSSKEFFFLWVVYIQTKLFLYFRIVDFLVKMLKDLLLSLSSLRKLLKRFKTLCVIMYEHKIYPQLYGFYSLGSKALELSSSDKITISL